MTRSLVGSVVLRSEATSSAVTGGAWLPHPDSDERHDVGDLLVGELLPELRHAIGIGRALDDERGGAVQHHVDERCRLLVEHARIAGKPRQIGAEALAVDAVAGAQLPA